MTISLIMVLIALCVVCVILYCAKLLIGAFNVPQPLATVLYVVVILICLLIILGSIGGLGPWATIRIG